MRIVVVDFAAKIGGAKSIIEDFYKFLIDSNDKNEWYFLLSCPLIESIGNIKAIVNPVWGKSWAERLIFDNISGGKIISKYNPDVVINFQNTYVNGIKKDQYIYLHQSIPFQKEKKFSLFRKEERVYAVYQYVIGHLIKQSVRKATGVFVQTKWMKDALKSYQLSERVHIIAPNVKHDYEIHCTKETLNCRGFFYPAAFLPYKNHSIIIEALKLNNQCSDIKMYFTTDAIPNISDDRIHYLGTISRDKVMELYKSNILIFPSYIETYGMPLKEAMTVGTIILAADTKFAHEILDGYENAYFFKPFDSEKLGSLMKDIYDQKIILKEISDSKCNKEEQTWEILVDVITKRKCCS